MLLPLLAGAPTVPSSLLAGLGPWACPAELPEPDPAPAPEWRDAPVAWAPHTVRFDYGRRYQELLAKDMGGPAASPVLGPIVATADTHWRLYDATGRGAWRGPDDPKKWRDAAASGALLAVDDLVEETLGRAPVLDAVYVAADTLVSPSFDLKREDDGRVVVRHRGGGPARRALERAEEEQGEVRGGRRTTPGIGLGLDWELRDEDAPESAPLVRYTAWAEATGLGITSLRAEVAPGSLAWSVGARQVLVPHVFAIASAHSVDRSWEPGRASAGLMWTPTGALSGWSVRAERIEGLAPEDRRWMLTIRREDHTVIPAPLDPPLGERGLGGPVLPWVPEHRGNVVEAWGEVRSPESGVRR